MRLSYCNFETKVNNNNKMFITLSNKEQGMNNIVIPKELMDQVVNFVTETYTPEDYKTERIIFQLYDNGTFVVKFDTPRMRLHKKFIFKKVAMNQNPDRFLGVIITMEKLMNELTK